MSESDDAMEIDGAVDLEIRDDVFADPLFYHAPVGAFDLMAHEALRKEVGAAELSLTARVFSPVQGSLKRSPLTLDRLLSYQCSPLLAPLLKASASCAARATAMFAEMQELTGHREPPVNEALISAQALLRSGVETVELKDELFMQLFKQTRGVQDDVTRVRTWRLFCLVAMTLAPSADFSGLLTHYVSQTCHDDCEMEEIRQSAAEIWSCLQRSVKSGSRKVVPSLEEISVVLFAQQKMKTAVHFLDGSLEDLVYDIGTTVRQAVAVIAEVIGLANSESFSLFVGTLASPDSDKPEAQKQLYDHSYVPDVLSQFTDTPRCLIFKKVMFRESDAYILESQFLNLSYLQAQYDYLMGHYPVGYEDAAKLCAFQLYSQHGSRLPQNESFLKKEIASFTDPNVSLTGCKEAWLEKVLECHRRLLFETREDARNCFLNLLRSLPYGMAIFFRVERHQDPIGLLPARLILGINKNGLHFLRWIPKEYLSSVDFRDISHFGFCSQTVYFKMKISGQLHSFQFATKRGQDICMALRTHIGDAASQRRDQGDSAMLPEVQFGKGYDKHLAKLERELNEAEVKLGSMKKALEMQEVDVSQSKQVARVQLASVHEKKASREAARKEVSTSQSDILNLRTQLSALKEMPSIELAQLEQYKQQEKDFLSLLEALTSKQPVLRECLEEMERTRSREVRALHAAIQEVKTEGRAACAEKDSQYASMLQKVADAEALIELNAEDIEKMTRARAELQELQQLKLEIAEKDRVHAAMLKQQTERIEQLEAMRKESQVKRKKAFNKLQDLKGRIRVYARVRPLLEKEEAKGQTVALDFPDAYSILHAWKRDAAPKEYTYDGVFPPEAAQTDVFSQTEDLIQTTMDGRNVCIFAYGQTGSGKTYTIYGDAASPGLAQRGIEKLFGLIRENSVNSRFVVKCYMLELYRDTLMDLLDDKRSKCAEAGRRFSELPVPSSPAWRRSSMPRLSECPVRPEKRKLAEVSHPQREKLEIKREKGGAQLVYVQGTTVVEVHSAAELMATFEQGQRLRHVAATQMNIQSSRSHLIMGIVVEGTDLESLAVTRGKLTFVDLAGSERLKKSGSEGEQLKEAQAINKSLSALGDVISSLARGDAHTPYRNHKLTMLMSDSIGGGAKTLMFVNVAPTEEDLSETQNSLQYATRVRTIKNEAVRDPAKEAERLNGQIKKWKAMEMNQDSAAIQEMLFPFLE